MEIRRRGSVVCGIGIGMGMGMWTIGRANGLAEEGIVEDGRSKGVAVIGGGGGAGAGAGMGIDVVVVVVVVGWQQKGALGDEERWGF